MVSCLAPESTPCISHTPHFRDNTRSILPKHRGQVALICKIERFSLLRVIEGIALTHQCGVPHDPTLLETASRHLAKDVHLSCSKKGGGADVRLEWIIMLRVFLSHAAEWRN